MAATASKLLDLARAEIGVKESPPGSNKVKYNDAYGQGDIHWCCVFLWWLFQQAGAPELFFNGKQTAYCPALQVYHVHMGQAVSGDYQPGDIVFFDFNGNGVADHVGLCESWDGSYITTIDGNTSATNPSNGGMVGRMRRHKKNILAAIRPEYDREEKEDMDKEQVLKIIREYEENKKTEKPNPDWGAEARDWALENRLIVGDDKGRPQWEASVTRNQLVTILYKFYKMIKSLLGA